MTLSKVLIVDDSKLARVTLRKKLQSYGLTVEMAESAAEAYEVLPKIKPDMIFMDHLMPVVSGFEATMHIRKMPGFAKTPIIMCSGKEHEGYLDEALAVGANHVLSKPPVDEELDAILKIDFAPTAKTAAALDESPAVQAPTMSKVGPATEEGTAVQMQLSSTGLSLSDVEAACRQVIAAEKAGLYAELQASVQAELQAVVPVIVSQQMAQVELPEPVVTQGMDQHEIETICRSFLAAEKAAMVAQVMAAIPEPVPVEPPPFRLDPELLRQAVDDVITAQLPGSISPLKKELTAQLDAFRADEPERVKAVVRTLLADEKRAIVKEVLATLPEPAAVEPSTQKTDLESVRQAVDEAITARLPESINKIRVELSQQLGSQIAEQVARQSETAIDRDISGLLDLRLNVVLAEKFVKVDKRFEELEALIAEKFSQLKASADMMSVDPDLVLEKTAGVKDFQAKKNIESQLDQIIERQERLDKSMLLPKVAALAALVVAIAAAVKAFL